MRWMSLWVLVPGLALAQGGEEATAHQLVPPPLASVSPAFTVVPQAPSVAKPLPNFLTVLATNLATNWVADLAHEAGHDAVCGMISGCSVVQYSTQYTELNQSTLTGPQRRLVSLGGASADFLLGGLSVGALALERDELSAENYYALWSLAANNLLSAAGVGLYIAVGNYEGFHEGYGADIATRVVAGAVSLALFLGSMYPLAQLERGLVGYRPGQFIRHLLLTTIPFVLSSLLLIVPDALGPHPNAAVSAIFPTLGIGFSEIAMMMFLPHDASKDLDHPRSLDVGRSWPWWVVGGTALVATSLLASGVPRMSEATLTARTGGHPSP